jgi:hypothetical protein
MEMAMAMATVNPMAEEAVAVVVCHPLLTVRLRLAGIMVGLWLFLPN